MGQDRCRRIAGDGAGPDLLARGAALSRQRTDGRCREGIDMQFPTGATRVVFILAHPATHVSAPRYYTPHFRQQGLDWHLVPLDVAPMRLTETIRTLAASASVVGFNLTMPHKPAAFGLCDAVTPAARFEGVVNTIRIEK